MAHSYTDLGGVPVAWFLDAATVGQDCRALPPGQTPNLYGPGAIFLDVTRGGAQVGYDDVAPELKRDGPYLSMQECLANQPPNPPTSTPPASDLPPEIVDALKRLTDAVNAVSSAVGSVTTTVGGQITGAIGGLEGSLKTTIGQITTAIGQQTSDVEQQVNQVRSDLSSKLDGAVSSVEGQISQSEQTIRTQLGTQIDAVGAQVNQAATQVTTAIGNETSKLEGQIGQIGQGIVQGIHDALQSFLPSLLSTLTSNTQALAGFVDSLQSDLASTSELWASAGQVAHLNLPAIISDLKRVAGEGLSEIIAGFLDTLKADAKPVTDAAIQDVLSSEALPQQIRDILEDTQHSSRLLSGLTSAAFALFLVGQVVEPFLAGELEKLRQTGQAAIRPTLPPIQDAIQAHYRGYVDDATVSDVGARSGLPDAWIATYHKLYQQQLDALTLIQLWRRGLIQPEERDHRLEALGYDPTDTQALVKLSDLLPTVTDALLFMTRDVFIPEIRSKFGQDAEFPSDELALFAQLGINEKLARDYWAAHWILPSVGQAFEMHQRTVDTPLDPDAEGIHLPSGKTVYPILSQASVNRLLRAQGLEPFWRPMLTAISYNPLTRVDIRRMHQAQVLSDDELTEQYLQIGYNLENATRLADFTIKLNKQVSTAAKDPLRKGLVSKAITAYEAGRLDDQTLRSTLSDLGYEEDEVSAFVAEAEFTRQSVLAEKLAGAISKLYIAGEWSADQTTAALASHGFAADAIARLLEVWQIDRTYKELTAEQKAQKELSKADIEGAMRDRLISDAEGSQLLATLGYSTAEVAVLVGRVALARTRATITQQTDTIKTLYTAGRLSRAEASARLDAVNLPPGQRETLLLRWDAEIAAKAPKFDISQVEQFYKAGIVADAEVHGDLAQRGYTNAQIDQLLALWGSQIQAEKKKEAAIEARRQRQLSQADILDAYRYGVVDRPAALAQLILIGLSAAQAAEILATADRRFAGQTGKKTRLESANQILAAFVADVIDAGQGLGQLEAVGYSQSDSAQLLATAEAKRKAPNAVKSKALSATQVLRAYRLLIVDRPTAAQDLIDMGYKAADANVLLDIVDGGPNVSTGS